MEIMVSKMVMRCYYWDFDADGWDEYNHGQKCPGV